MKTSRRAVFPPPPPPTPCIPIWGLAGVLRPSRTPPLDASRDLGIPKKEPTGLARHRELGTKRGSPGVPRHENLAQGSVSSPSPPTPCIPIWSLAGVLRPSRTPPLDASKDLGIPKQEPTGPARHHKLGIKRGPPVMKTSRRAVFPSPPPLYSYLGPCGSLPDPL